MHSDSSGGHKSDSRYIIISEIGNGTYGNVFKAYDEETKSIVALKLVRKFSSQEGLPLSFYRELSSLQEFQGHPNIVQTYGVTKIPSNGQDTSLYIILEYAHYDLSYIIRSLKSGLSLSLFLNISVQIMNGLSQLHSKNYVHRDIKPSNILINNCGDVKLADFGLTRLVNNSVRFSSKVVTPGYRAPELLLGCQSYGLSIDIWSLGCLFYEMIVGSPLFSFKDSTELPQLLSIFDICGTPTPETAPFLFSLPGASLLSIIDQYHPSKLHEKLIYDLPIDFHPIIPLLLSMLSLDPQLRPSINDIINYPFFRNHHLTEISSIVELNLPEKGTHGMTSSKFKGKNNQKSKQILLDFQSSSILHSISPPKISPPLVYIH